jgi:hypothetical protein
VCCRVALQMEQGCPCLRRRAESGESGQRSAHGAFVSDVRELNPIALGQRYAVRHHVRVTRSSAGFFRLL